MLTWPPRCQYNTRQLLLLSHHHRPTLLDQGRHGAIRKAGWECEEKEEEMHGIGTQRTKGGSTKGHCVCLCMSVCVCMLNQKLLMVNIAEKKKKLYTVAAKPPKVCGWPV